VFEFWDLIGGAAPTAMLAVGDFFWAPQFQRLVGWAGYTSAVFVLGRLSATVNWSTFFDSISNQTSDAVAAKFSPGSCDGLLTEIRQELDTHSAATRRLNERLVRTILNFRSFWTTVALNWSSIQRAVAMH
jgi:hypothetical protein